MGTAELEEALRREGAEQARAIVEAAREKARAARTADDAAWETQRREALARAEAEADAGTRTRLIDARRAAKRRILEARHRAIERVLEAVREQLARMDTGAPKLDELLEFLPTRDVEIREEGFVLEARDGSLTVDATLGRRLERLRPLLAIRILQLIDAEVA